MLIRNPATGLIITRRSPPIGDRNDP